MREILFRGKRVDNGEWVCGYYVYDESGQLTEKAAPFIYRLNVHPCGCSLIPYEVIPETVGQYTGMRDDKRTKEYPEGQMIFEGDIVLFPWGEKREVFSVEFVEGGFEAILKRKSTDIWCIRIGSYSPEFEVIGNIHDNPELIGGEGDA